MKAYIDVRGFHPIYIKGMIAIELRNAPRGISVQQAEELINGQS